MSLRAAALSYGDTLLYLLQREVVGVHRPRGLADAFHQQLRWQRIADLCDRFERLMANLPPVPQPLVWEGDYA